MQPIDEWTKSDRIKSDKGRDVFTVKTNTSFRELIMGQKEFLEKQKKDRR